MTWFTARDGAKGYLVICLSYSIGLIVELQTLMRGESWVHLNAIPINRCNSFRDIDVVALIVVGAKAKTFVLYT